MSTHNERTARARPAELAFRWRSFLPLAAIAALSFGVLDGRSVEPQRLAPWVAGGSVLAALGLALRLYAIGHAPIGASGRHREQYAGLLNTFGVYSVLRHPLYLGNILVWVGVSATSGWPLGTLLSATAAAAMFGLIVHHEDAYLAERFGSDFEEWAAATPAFVPRFELWRTARRPFDWPQAVASEYSTLHSIGLLALLFAAAREGVRDAGGAPGPGWWALLAANGGLYLGLRLWRAKRLAS